jgi:hypothetical protein
LFSGFGNRALTIVEENIVNVDVLAQRNSDSETHDRSWRRRPRRRTLYTIEGMTWLVRDMETTYPSFRWVHVHGESAAAVVVG